MYGNTYLGYADNAEEPVVIGLSMIHNKANNNSQVTILRGLLKYVVDENGEWFYQFPSMAQPHKIKFHHIVCQGKTVDNLYLLNGTSTIYKSYQTYNRYFNRAWMLSLDNSGSKVVVVESPSLVSESDLISAITQIDNMLIFVEDQWGKVLKDKAYRTFGKIPENTSWNQATGDYKDAIEQQGYQHG